MNLHELSRLMVIALCRKPNPNWKWWKFWVDRWTYESEDSALKAFEKIMSENRPIIKVSDDRNIWGSIKLSREDLVQ